MVSFCLRTKIVGFYPQYFQPIRYLHNCVLTRILMDSHEFTLQLTYSKKTPHCAFDLHCVPPLFVCTNPSTPSVPLPHSPSVPPDVHV
jgi:hypothetical protein